MDEDESKPLLEGETSGKIQEDDQSVEVKLRDFQLIRVPRERVSCMYQYLHVKSVALMNHHSTVYHVYILS